MAKIKVSFEQRDKQIGELLEQVLDLKQKLEYMTLMFKQGNPDAFEVHKDKLPKISQETEQTKEIADKLEIPII